MTNKKSILFLIAACLTVNICSAQNAEGRQTPEKYRAVHFGIENGLSWSSWNNMLKDANGFLWITSQHGFNRFDGNSFKYYYPSNKKPGAIRSSYQSAIIEDSLHNLWIGTDRGLSVYNIKEDIFNNTFPDTVYTPFWATKNEVYCIEWGKRILAYNIYTLVSRTLISLTSADEGCGDVRAKALIFDDTSNSIWMPEGDEALQGGGLYQISLTDGKRQHFNWECYKHIPRHSHCSEGMKLDPKRHCIWINSNDGLIQFNLSDKEFHYIDAVDHLADLKNFEKAFDGWHWVGITLDLHDKVWFASVRKGIVIYDPGQNVAEPAFATGDSLQNDAADFNVSLYCDHEGILWSSYWLKKGIYEIIPYSPSVYRYTQNVLHFNSYHSNRILPANHNLLWIGTDYDKLYIWDPQTGTTKELSAKDFPGVKETAIGLLAIDTLDGKGWLYAEFPQKIYEMNLETRQCKPVVFRDTSGQIMPIINMDISSVRSCTTGTFFFVANQSIFKISSDSPVARQIIIFPKNEENVYHLAVPEEKRVFLHFAKATPNFTFTNTNRKWIHTPNPLDSVDWFDIYYDKTDQSYWAGGAAELAHFDKNFHLVRRYTDKDDLPPLGTSFIIPDNYGNLWFNNSGGDLSQLNMKTGQIATLSDKDGYQRQLFEWTAPFARDVRGDLYFAGDKGIDRISPYKFISTPAVIYLQSLDVNQKPYPLSTGINNLQHLSLRYFENKITIETGTIDYYSRGKNRIRFKLEGGKIENAAWQYAPNYYTIRYEELPPGRYKLIMQAGNVANEFTGSEKILFINISPAFWETWWFRVFAFLFLVDLIYTIVRWRLKQKFKLQLERSENEREVAELQQQKTELEMQALRAQMNPHFIFNSLNSINRFILQNNRTQASEYLTKFSKLVRMILQNSQASLISLESELESLNLYLDLEAVRFEHRFAYKISYSKDLDIEVLQVPPLVIQPFTENAIWHGLMHKEEKGQLDIDVSEEDDCLYIKITDNGIGRKKAGEMANKSTTKHKSMGLRITKDRIAMLQKSNGGESPVRIIDLENEDGSAAGTEVIIKMPVIEEA